MTTTRVLIAGAAGRDFHNFNLVYRGRQEVEVVAFTATQIPNIDGRVYPPELAGELYPDGMPVVAVCAVRTGSGKSQTTRRVAQILRDSGKRVAVLRHPMPYGDLSKQAVQRFERYEDLEPAEATIEEREEYEPHLAEGTLVFAGIDYARILERAEEEA